MHRQSRCKPAHPTFCKKKEKKEKKQTGTIKEKNKQKKWTEREETGRHEKKENKAVLGCFFFYKSREGATQPNAGFIHHTIQ